LRWLAAQLAHVPGVRVSFDLADLRGYAYYSGARFAVYVPGASDALVRGGRYDGIGAAFDHGQRVQSRPAAGFSLDLKALVSIVPVKPLRAAICAPWTDPDASAGDAQSASSLRTAIAALRRQGETVVCILPGHECEIDEFNFDRALCRVDGQWQVQVKK
jgi:ATP phosphoribosyltransferase regulatory subunit